MKIKLTKYKIFLQKYHQMSVSLRTRTNEKQMPVEILNSTFKFKD